MPDIDAEREEQFWQEFYDKYSGELLPDDDEDYDIGDQRL